jgi:hypothetical protein
MAQLLGANDLHSFVANPSIIYYYAYDTEVDNFFFYLMRDIHSHFMFDKININWNDE